MRKSTAQRLAALPPYLFVEIDRRKQAAIAAGKDVISFGVGDPEHPTPGFVVDALAAAARKAEYHRYPHDRGMPAFRAGVAAWFAERYGVALDPDREVLTLIGSKEGLGHLALAVVDPGDTVLIPDPGYPVYASGTIFAGGTPMDYALHEDRGWLPDLSEIPSETARAAKLMFVNYPSNPLGATAPLSFYRELVDFAQQHELIIAQDAAYNEMYFDETDKPHSILEVEGARDCCIEFHSASKTFNMTGWRVGFAVGNADVIDALAKIKSNLDSGQFHAIQEAALAAYQGFARDEVREIRARYGERAKLMAAGLRELGFRVAEPKATFYLWAGLPDGQDAMGASSRLIEEAAIVAIPGVGFGSRGEGYVRFALTASIERCREALERMRKMDW